MAAATVDLTEAQYDVADRIELAMEADPDATWTPSALAKKVRADYDDVVTVLRWLVAGQYGVTTCGKGGAWTRYCLTEHKRDNARRALATDDPELHDDDDTAECQLCGGHLLIDPCMPGITVHESTGTAECGPVTGHVLTDEALAAHSAPVEILGAECSTQDTTAAALIPGDVVLGPDGWVIVGQVDTRTATETVVIYPAGSSTSFGRAYEDRVAVQPDADTQSSASCQHFIETGRYLRREEAPAPALMVACPSCGWAHRDPTNARCARCRRA